MPFRVRTPPLPHDCNDDDKRPLWWDHPGSTGKHRQDMEKQQRRTRDITQSQNPYLLLSLKQDGRLLGVPIVASKAREAKESFGLLLNQSSHIESMPVLHEKLVPWRDYVVPTNKGLGWV